MTWTRKSYLEETDVASRLLAKALGGESKGLRHLMGCFSLSLGHDRQIVLALRRLHKSNHHPLNLHRLLF